jgi:hypothetical protein
MARFALVSTAIFVLVLMFASFIQADIPQLISFQGKLYNGDGNPLTGQHEITFRIYNVETGGAHVWLETINVDCDNGLYTVILGQTALINLDFDGQYWLGVQVTGDDELSPRYRLVSVPTAFRAQVANQVSWTNLTDVPAGFADGTDDVGAAGGVSQIDAGTGIDVTNPTGPTATVAADIGTGADQVAAGDHDHDSDYVNEGQVNSITTGMIVNGTIQQEDLSFTPGADGDWTMNGDDIYRESGNVGIGTTSPAYSLHIRKVNTGNWIAGIHNMGSGTGDHGLVVRADGGDPFLVQSGTANVLNAKQNGYVGIGTNSPDAGLHVVGPGWPASFLFIDANGGNYDTGIRLLDSGVTRWHLFNDHALGDVLRIEPEDSYGSLPIAILQNGNVGIGTTSPESKLDVVGSSSNSIVKVTNTNSSGHGVHCSYAGSAGEGFLCYSGGPRNAGVCGRTTDATGVYGSANIGTGVYGESDAGWGVYGKSDSNHGVHGESSSGTGVSGESSTGNAGYFLAKSDNPSEALVIFSAGSGDLIEARTPGFLFSDVEFRVTNNGNVQADGSYTSPAADFAELVEANGKFEPGDVLVIGSNGNFCLSNEPNSPLVAGIYSARPGFVGGASTEEDENDGKIPMAINGFVPCKVTMENGNVRPGDLLVSSSTPGHAMKAVNPKPGTIVAKALESSDSDGLIKVLVALQ